MILHLRTARYTTFRTAAATCILALAILVPVVAPRAAGAQEPAEAPTVLAEHEVWWNEDWARILEMSGGSWTVRTGAEFTVLEPGDDACKLVILARGTGEVFEYDMQAEGGVVLGFGWIMVSPDRANLIHALDSTPPVTRESILGGFAGREAHCYRAERISWRGDGEWLVGRVAAPEHRFYVGAAEPPARGGNKVAYHSVTGEVVEYPTEAHRSFVLVQLQSYEITKPPDDRLMIGSRRSHP